MRIQIRRARTLLAALVLGAGQAVFVPAATAQDTPVPKSTCTATNVGGSGYEGLVCGGSVIDDCTPGAIYRCVGGGVQDPVNNCVLEQVCTSGCLTGLNSTPPTANTDFPVANDACFAGARPLTVAPVAPLGGSDVRVTATLSVPQNTPNGPILNLRGGGTLIPHPFCAVPFRLAPGATTGPASVTFDLPTAVVDRVEVVNLDALISYNDTSGRTRTLVSIPFSVRLQPGGTEPPPPAVRSVTALPSAINPGGLAVGDVTLEKFAPANGVRATLTSSRPDVLSVIENNQPFVMGACTTSTGVVNLQAAPVVDQDTTVTISATSGAPNEAAATTTITVRATPLAVARVSMSPHTVLAGASSTGTLTMTRAAPPGGAQVFLTTSEPVVTVPASVVVPAGATSVTFTATTRADATAFASATIRTSFNGDDFGATAQLQVWPAGTAQAVQALTVEPSSVVGPASAIGRVTLRYAPPSSAATVTLSSSNTAVARVPATLTFPAGVVDASFGIATSAVAGATAATITAALGNAQSEVLTVRPANPPPPSAVLTSYSVTPASVTAGQSVTGTVTLASPAPSPGVPVDLSSSLPLTIPVPASVTVPAGATTASFTVQANQPSGTTTVTLAATLNGTSLTDVVTVSQAPAAPSLSGLTVTPTTVTGGASSTGRVTLTGAAPSGGVVVSLTDDSGAATLPASVTVPSGATAATFTITTTTVASTTVVAIDAVLGSASRRATLTVSPADTGGGAPGFSSAAGNAPDTGGDGNGFESGATSAYGDDAAAAVDTNSGSGTSTSCTSTQKDRHRFFDFGLAVPAGSAVAGLEVRVDARADSTSGAPRLCVQLSWNGGATWTAARATATLGTTMRTFTLGGAADTWGRPWTPAELSNANFRVRIIPVSSSTSRDFFLDWVAVRPHAGTAPTASLGALGLNPAAVTGGGTSTGTVTLTSAAPAGGFSVSLSSSNPAAAVPAALTVPQGATSATFSITTATVTAPASVTISATGAGVTRTASLAVNPASTSQDVQLTVTASGRSGERVTSSPAGINAAVGSSASASFASGTRVTLTVSNSREAIWSGACSSGGNKQRTCAFTITGNASVSANVQ